MKFAKVLGAFWALGLMTGAMAQNDTREDVPDTNVARPDYTVGAPVFPHVWKPYQWRPVPDERETNSQPLQVRDGKLQLSMQQVIDAVIGNSLAVAAARLYPSIAQTDLLRARSGQSPRGVDVAEIPSAVFSGAVGGSILGGGGGGGGGGASNAGGITGSASAVNIRPGGVFDPQFNLSLSLDHTTSPLNSVVVAGLPSVTTTTLAFSTSYTQLFPTGTSISVSYGANRQASNQLHLLYNPDFTPGFTATIAQQLLNGFGTAVNRALIEVAQNEQKIERESFRAQVVTALAAAQNAYWDLIAAQEAVRAAELELKAAEQLVDNNRKEFDVGVMSRLDITTAESQAAASQRDLVVARTNEQYAELTLKTQLSKNLDEPLASAAIVAVDPFPEPGQTPLPSLEDALTIARTHRPEVTIAEGNIKSETDVRPFIRNSLLPQLNVYGLVSNVGLYNVFSTSFLDAVEFKYPQVAVGISLSFNIHNRQAQADDLRSRLELRQAQDTLVRTKSQIEVDVQNGLTAARQAQAQLAAASEALRLAQVQLDAEQKRLTAGISNPYNVVLRQRDVFTARLAEVQARDAYAKARVTLDQAMGTTFDTDHVNIDQALRRR